jgi:hypothetical protein
MSKQTYRLNRYIKIADIFDMTWNQLKGYVGERLVIDRLRAIFNYPFKVKIHINHNRTNAERHKPDIELKIGSKLIQIEVKNWIDTEIVSGSHIYHHGYLKDWLVGQSRLMLFVVPKEFNAEAQEAVKRLGMTIINGLNLLPHALVLEDTKGMLYNSLDGSITNDKYMATNAVNGCIGNYIDNEGINLVNLGNLDIDNTILSKDNINILNDLATNALQKSQLGGSARAESIYRRLRSFYDYDHSIPGQPSRPLPRSRKRFFPHENSWALN